MKNTVSIYYGNNDSEEFFQGEDYKDCYLLKRIGTNFWKIVLGGNFVNNPDDDSLFMIADLYGALSLMNDLSPVVFEIDKTKKWSLNEYNESLGLIANKARKYICSECDEVFPESSSYVDASGRLLCPNCHNEYIEVTDEPLNDFYQIV